MSTTIEQTKAATFLSDPILERYSHSLGEMRFYPPDAPPSEWGKLPWRLESAKGFDGTERTRLIYVVHPDHRDHCWKHPALIEARHLWPGL